MYKRHTAKFHWQCKASSSGSHSRKSRRSTDYGPLIAEDWIKGARRNHNLVLFGITARQQIVVCRGSVAVPFAPPLPGTPHVLFSRLGCGSYQHMGTWTYDPRMKTKANTREKCSTCPSKVSQGPSRAMNSAHNIGSNNETQMKNE